jgi:hypothetical protein
VRRAKIIVVLWGMLAIAGISNAATLDINNSIQTYSSLSNTIVTMTGRSELHLTSATAPMPGCQINLNSSDSWVFLDAIRPSVVASTYLGQIRVNGTAAVLNSNVRIVQYVTGTVVIPHGPGYQPLQIFNGFNFTGTSMNLGLYTYYQTDQLGLMNNAISSFRLKRGYMATFAQESNGTGISRVYIAQDDDLQIGVMPPELNNTVSFVRVFPWRWATQKGWAGGDNDDAATLNCSWRYDWNNTATSTLDEEYVPMRHNRYWNSYENINSKVDSTHVLGFNEPDAAGDNNMSVAEALSRWPNLLASGLRLGSPVATDGGLSWLYDFIDQADALNYRIDFVAVHYYKNNWTASQMYNWLRDIHLRTGRPLWVTEWNNGCNWTSPDPTYQQNADKINELITMLASTSFVERYSIYQWCTNREMFYTDGTITPAGIVYRDHVSPIANTLDTNKTYVGYYRLDEISGTTAADLSGNEMHGTLKNGLSFGNNSVSGKLGYGLHFDGVNDYIEMPAGFNEFNNGFSATLWANPTAVKNWARFIDFGNGANNNNIIFTREGTTNTLTFQAFSGSTGGSYVRAANAIDLNVWQFFAVTVDNFGNIKIYKNGQLIQTGAATAPTSVQRTANYIGRSNWSADAYYQGDMDDIRMFDYALSANEVTALYTIDTSVQPYDGVVAVIPGRIEAERFNLGGQGVSYRDITLGNGGGAFRPDEDVDIRAINDYGNGYAVTQIAAGEWMQYTVNISEASDYCLYFRASATTDNIPVTVKLNNTALGTIIVNNTGSLNTFQTFTLNNLTLTAGSNQILRLEFPNGGLEVNWIQFEKKGPWGGQSKAIPGKVEAEAFDFGGPGVAYHDTTISNSGGQFRTYEDVDIAGVTDGGAGYAVDAIETGEWLFYTVNSTAAQMDVYARIASTQDGGQIRILLDGELLATINVPNTGSLTTWQTVSAACLPLPNRENANLKLEFAGTGFRLNWIQFQNQMPFLGVPLAIPGRIEFENYDLGGQQISWFDTAAGNAYGGYRPQDDVDIMAITDNGAGFAVYDTTTEWLEYTCNIEAGTYTIVIRHTSNLAAQQLTLSRGTENLATFILPKTNGWSNWQNTALSDIYLTGGEQVLGFKMDLSTSLLNYVDFIRQYNPADMTLTGQVNIDDFAILAAQWLTTPGVPSADIAPSGGDGIVNFLDLTMLVDNWLVVQ